MACLPAAPSFIPEGPWRAREGGVAFPHGFRAAGIEAGLRGGAGGRKDLALVVAEGQAAAAGVFTQCKVAAAPVEVCREALARSRLEARAIVANAGQANAATGEGGKEDARECMRRVANELECKDLDVLMESTGVIGDRLAVDPLVQNVGPLVGDLGRGREKELAAAEAITTTDTMTKEAAMELDLGGRAVRLGGMAKGSGMIHPNMGTMLAAVTCDASVDKLAWNRMIKRAVEATFNQVTIDGCTSTNDAVIGLAGGAGGMEIGDDSYEAEVLEMGVSALCQSLAKQMAYDGEGASALIEVTVAGAASDEEARKAARAIAGSHLFKAAVHGCDPNWGRVAAAVGSAGVALDAERGLSVAIGDSTLMEHGRPLRFDKGEVANRMRQAVRTRGTLPVHVHLGVGSGYGTAWGCDLTPEYVHINAEYTT